MSKIKFRRNLSKHQNLHIPIHQSTQHRMHGSIFQNAWNLNNLVSVPILKTATVDQRRAKLAVWNVRSLRNKVGTISDFIVSNHVDILSITETWLSKHDYHTSNGLLNSLKDYDLYHRPRHGRGGGFGAIVRKGFTVSENPSTDYKSFEYVDLNISLKQESFRLLAVYRPPPSKKNKLTSTMLFLVF